MITSERIKELLSYDPETGEFVWRVTRNHKVKAGDIAGHLNRLGYRDLVVDYNQIGAHRVAWIYVHGSIPKGMFIDHINGIPSDNRMENLRLATPAENSRNRKTHQVGKWTSLWKGVTKTQWGFAATICTTENGKSTQHWLGSFRDEREAAEEYIFAALELHGEFARLS
jgi:hypothetical protein